MMSWDLLSSLLDDVYDIKTMMRSLDMTSLNYLNHMIGGIHEVKELMMRLDHLNSIHSQILRLPCTCAITRLRA